MIEIDRFGDARRLIKIEQPGVRIRVTQDAPRIVFEVEGIHGIESDQSAKKWLVGVHQTKAEEKAACCEPHIEFIQCCDERAACSFAGSLGCGESGTAI